MCNSKYCPLHQLYSWEQSLISVLITALHLKWKLFPHLIHWQHRKHPTVFLKLFYFSSCSISHSTLNIHLIPAAGSGHHSLSLCIPQSAFHRYCFFLLFLRLCSPSQQWWFGTLQHHSGPAAGAYLHSQWFFLAPHCFPLSAFCKLLAQDHIQKLPPWL